MKGYRQRNAFSLARNGSARAGSVHGEAAAQDLASRIVSQLSRLVWDGAPSGEVLPGESPVDVPLFHDVSAQVQVGPGQAVVRVQLSITYGVSIPDATAFIYPYLVQWTREALAVEQVQVLIDVEDLWFPADDEAW